MGDRSAVLPHPCKRPFFLQTVPRMFGRLRSSAHLCSTPSHPDSTGFVHHLLLLMGSFTSHPLSSPHSSSTFCLPRPLLSLTCASRCSSSLPRVSIDPAKRQTAKTGSVNPSTQGGKTLSKSSAFRFLSLLFYFLPSLQAPPPLACPHSIHQSILSFLSLFLLCMDFSASSSDSRCSVFQIGEQKTVVGR